MKENSVIINRETALWIHNVFDGLMHVLQQEWKYPGIDVIQDAGGSALVGPNLNLAYPFY